MENAVGMRLILRKFGVTLGLVPRGVTGASALALAFSGLMLFAGCSSEPAAPGAAVGGVAVAAPGDAVATPGETPAADVASFLGGVFPDPGETPASSDSDVLSGLADLAPLAPLSPEMEAGARKERAESSALCTEAWRSVLLGLGNQADYGAMTAAASSFREDYSDCVEGFWDFSMIPEASEACTDVVFGQGLGPLPVPSPTGWHAEGRALWVNFDQSPLGTGGGCWLYVDSAGWLERSGDGGEKGRLLTIFEMDSAAPGYETFRVNGMLNCDHRLRGHLTGIVEELDPAQLVQVVDGFRSLPGNIECAGVGWFPVAVADSELCRGVPAGDRPSGVYSDGAIVVHWGPEAKLGSGGQCWTYDGVEGAWFRSLDRGAVAPGSAGDLSRETPGGFVGEADGRAYEVDSPVAGSIAVLGDVAPLLADAGRSEVCDLVLKSVLLLNPMPRTPPDFAFLINAIQHGVDGGVCVAERWSPGVRGRMPREAAAGVLLPAALREGTGYDEETGSLRVVFFDDERPFDGAREWIWLSGGTGWRSLY